MTPPLLDKFLGRPADSFVRAARERGVKSVIARTLEFAAAELVPGNPISVLESRELFEQAALKSVIGDAGNLELSFRLVDALASTLEMLELARSSDVPDPFRRVWVSNDAGVRERGVVLRVRGGEIAVFCPPGEDGFSSTGRMLRVSYRGFSSSVEYDLELNDAVRLPGALVLHLTRADGEGAIGRDNRRFEAEIPGRIREIADEGTLAPPYWAFRTIDLSAGGLAATVEYALPRGTRVDLELAIPDGSPEALEATAVVRWVRDKADGLKAIGLEYESLSEIARDRVTVLLHKLQREAGVE